MCKPRANCVCACDGEEGLRVLSELVIQPDFIFADLNMPNVDGFGFLKQVKKSEFKEIPFYIYTTSRSDADKERASKFGASMFITKPSGIKQTVDILKKILL
jgi:CheY-like chemotaxis protein